MMEVNNKKRKLPEDSEDERGRQLCPSRMMMFICITLMILCGIPDSRSEELKVVGPTAPLLAVAGEDVILPCYIKPNISAVEMRVEWFRLDVEDSLVHLYEDHEDRNIKQSQSYRRRTKLSKEHLQTGNASLKLSAVKVSDEGTYKCFIESKSWSDDVTVNVSVEAVGSHPLIIIDGFDHSAGLRLRCESKGWNPEPDLVWLDSEGVSLSSEATESIRDSDGFSVKQTITVYNSDTKYHCRVKLRHHMLETEIINTGKLFSLWRSSVGLISVGVLLSVIAVILTAVFVKKHREHRRKMQNALEEKRRMKNATSELESEKRKLQNVLESLKRSMQNEIKHHRTHAVNVTLDLDSAHPRLIISEDEKEMRAGEQTSDRRSQNMFDKHPCVLGKKGFSSGRFYFVVQVKGVMEWDLGVARESVNRKRRIILNPMNGYWTMGLSYGYHAGESPHVPLSLSVKPQKVGVFVDYDEGRVSFYDVENYCHIYTYSDQTFNEKLYPFFRLDPYWSKHVTAPLRIVDV